MTHSYADGRPAPLDYDRLIREAEESLRHIREIQARLERPRVCPRCPPGGTVYQHLALGHGYGKF